MEKYNYHVSFLTVLASALYVKGQGTEKYNQFVNVASEIKFNQLWTIKQYLEMPNPWKGTQFEWVKLYLNQNFHYLRKDFKKNSYYRSWYFDNNKRSLSIKNISKMQLRFK